ncbi:hypothetical protein M422DRAFT_259323 [Sphaerobolus stellatus SS14]|uniref:Uncharacterized protein n=1 Tax=Sphaerobolus stellatus (strain SS14) TaxID=990650 RepID=A0A0C9VKV1_SPHS4|nr:hypothetical protein M422DRAFT_259323 [Sphaerobolus stellatus SS14]
MDDLEDLPQISKWEGLTHEDYALTDLATDLVQCCQELHDYMAVICKNLKILTNRMYIVEDELLRKVLDSVTDHQKMTDYGEQRSDPMGVLLNVMDTDCQAKP